MAVPLVQDGGGSAGPGTVTATTTDSSTSASGGTAPAADIDGPAFVFVSEHGHGIRVSGFEFLIALSLLGVVIDLYPEVMAGTRSARTR